MDIIRLYDLFGKIVVWDFQDTLSAGNLLLIHLFCQILFHLRLHLGPHFSGSKSAVQHVDVNKPFSNLKKRLINGNFE